MLDYRISPEVCDTDLNRLFTAAWPGHRERAFGPVLSRSLAYVCAFDAFTLVGFVNVAWDGGQHAFLLDTTVLPTSRRQGVGSELVRRAVESATSHGVEWLHVDYKSRLDGFYRGCGFGRTEAGLMRLARTRG